MTDEGDEVKLECPACKHDLVFDKTPALEWITVCSRCASPLVHQGDMKLEHAGLELHNKMPEGRRDAIGVIIEHVQNSKKYKKWVLETCKLLLTDFAKTSMARGLTLEEVSPAVKALLSNLLENTRSENKADIIVSIVEALGGLAIPIRVPGSEPAIDDDLVNSKGGSA